MFDKVQQKANLLFNFLDINPTATYAEIEKETGIKRQTACRILKQFNIKKYDNRFKNVSRETTFFNAEKLIEETKDKTYSIKLRGDKN